MSALISSDDVRELQDEVTEIAQSRESSMMLPSSPTSSSILVENCSFIVLFSPYDLITVLGSIHCTPLCCKVREEESTDRSLQCPFSSALLYPEFSIDSVDEVDDVPSK